MMKQTNWLTDRFSRLQRKYLVQISTMVANIQVEIENSCETIVKKVRSTRLNYGIHETPHSIYFTIRKSLNKSSKISEASIQLSTSPQFSEESAHYTSELRKLNEANNNLKHLYEDAVLELEKKSDYIKTLEDKVEILHEKLTQTTEETTTNKLRAFEEEKRLLQVKHEKVCAEFKIRKRKLMT